MAGFCCLICSKFSVCFTVGVKNESKPRKANPVFTEGLGGDGGCEHGTGASWAAQHPPEPSLCSCLTPWLALLLPGAAAAGPTEPGV